MKNFLHPTLKELKDENPNLTVVGLYWAGLWRIYAWIGIVCVIIAGLGALLDN